MNGASGQRMEEKAMHHSLFGKGDGIRLARDVGPCGDGNGRKGAGHCNYMMRSTIIFDCAQNDDGAERRNSIG